MKKDKTPTTLKIFRWFFPKLELIAPFFAKRLFVKLFFSPLRYTLPQKEEETQKRAARFFITVKSQKIACYSWGGGPMILVVHGWAGRASQFRKFIEALTQLGYRVVGFDGPAHGNSTGNRTNIDEFEEVIKRLYQSFGEPKAIIAHSFGGGAVLYSAMNGLPVKKLINIASPTIGDEIIKTYLRAINGNPKTGEFFKSYILKKYGKGFNEFTALHFVKNLKQEIDLLLVYDEDDIEVGPQHAEELVKVYPKAKSYRTKGLGHTRILRDEEVIRRCVTFIEQ